jgi:RNA polymerase sigma-70 factor (ECF subfamily)
VVSLSSLSSEDLVKACVGLDNEAAWAEFIRRFQPLVARVVSRMTRRNWAQAPPHLLDDLIQDIYLKLCADDYRLLRRFESRQPDSIFGFLKVVAASVVLDYFKGEMAQKRDLYQTGALSEQMVPDPPNPAGDGCLSMEDRIALRQINDIVGTLYTGHILMRNRAIFWFHYRDGMTAEAIAFIPWIKLNTKGVESLLRRMKNLVQAQIGSGS